MHRLCAVSERNQIFPEYRDTPIGLLLEYHNLGRNLDNCSQAQLLIGMCMDNRKTLRIPDNFAYIIRTGGANPALQRVQRVLCNSGRRDQIHRPDRTHPVRHGQPDVQENRFP